MSETPAEGRITCETRGPLLLIGIDRPAKYNGFTPRMFRELGEAYSRLDDDAGLRVGVLHAHGKHFTAGLDLPTIAPFMQRGEKLIKPGDVEPTDLGTPGYRRRTKPLVCAVKGITFTLGIELMLAADKFTPVDAGLIPTGVLEPVAGTPFDFRTSTVIGKHIHDNNEQLKLAGGYDFNWVLRGANGESKTAARVYDPETGRVLTVTTTEPGVQFYTGNFLDGTVHGKIGKPYVKNGALCLETQHFPDSPNHPNFPSTELKPGAPRHSTTTFTFTTHAK